MAAEYKFEHLARLIRDRHTGTVMLQIVRDPEIVEIKEGDEFVTIRTVVEL